MASFRRDILQQIERIGTGRIFTFGNLSFPNYKLVNVAAPLSEQSKKGMLDELRKEFISTLVSPYWGWEHYLCIRTNSSGILMKGIFTIK